MALPTPTTPRPHKPHHVKRAVGKVAHPKATITHAYEKRQEAKPVPPPRTEAELAGGGIRRRYIHTRIKWSRFWRGIPNWPMTVQVIACVAVGALIGGAVIEARRMTSPQHKNRLAAFANSDSEYKNAYATTKPGTTRLLLTGDISVYDVAQAVDNDYSGQGSRGLTYSEAGCGINASQSIVQNKPLVKDAACKDWEKDYR